MNDCYRARIPDFPSSDLFRLETNMRFDVSFNPPRSPPFTDVLLGMFEGSAGTGNLAAAWGMQSTPGLVIFQGS